MYLATRPPSTSRVSDASVLDAPDDGPAPAAPDGTRPSAPPTERLGWFGVQRNVVMLGITSLLTDISSEMVASVLPIYFVLQLGFSPIQFGAFDGIYQGLAAVLCIGAALAADRRQRHKRVAELGYGLSALTRLGLVLASGAWVPLVGFLYLDRLGKGIRTAPRDALISMSSTRDRLGASFGVHRALDTTGAVLGPLVGAFLLARNPAGFDVVFMTSFFVAVIGVGVMVCFVQERRAGAGATATVDHRDHETDETAIDAPVEVHDLSGVGGLGGISTAAVLEVAGPESRPHTVRQAVGLLRDRSFRRIFLVATVFALLTPGDALLFLALERRTNLSAAYFPLLYFGASVVFLSLAIPAGWLADRVGRAKVFIAGEALLLGAFLLVGGGETGLGVVLAVLVLLGAFYAATDGVLMAMASATIPEAVRTSGLALIVAAVAVGHLVAAVTFGILWSRVGPTEAIQLFAAGLAFALVGCGWVLLGRRPSSRDAVRPGELVG